MQLTELVKLLEPPERHCDGYLILKSEKAAWKLSFIQGLLLYAENGLHDNRFWKRNFKRYFPQSKLNTNSSNHTDSSAQGIFLSPQLRSLIDGIEQRQLSVISSKLMIRHLVQEHLFELAQCESLAVTWQPASFPMANICRNIALSAWERKMTLSRIGDMQRKWLLAGLGNFSPSLSPKLKKDIKTPFAQIHLPIEHQYLRGDFTVWEIATQLDKQPLEIATVLKPLADNEILEFLANPDLPFSSELLTESPVPTRESSPLVNSQPRPNAKSSNLIRPSSSPLDENTPLIACIDDSPVLAHGLKKILVSAGYRALIIQEPMRGFTQLIEQKPDLILLDLMLPNADGYSVCKFLRDTPVFKQTPIIVLTGKSRPVDRARARLVGATEFITKPPEPESLITMIRNHLELRSTVQQDAYRQ